MSGYPIDPPDPDPELDLSDHDGYAEYEPDETLDDLNGWEREPDDDRMQERRDQLGL